MTANNTLIPLTDDRGRSLLSQFDYAEPNPGSIVLTSGEFGTAWQKHFSDGLWYPAAKVGHPTTWDRLILRRNVVLVYDAAERSK